MSSTRKKRTEGGTLGGGAPLEERLGMLNVSAAPREGSGIQEIKPQKSKKQPVGIVEIGADGAFELPDDAPEELEEEEDEFDDNSEVPTSTSTSGPASAAAVPLADAIAEALNDGDDDEPPALDDDEPPMPSPVNPAAAAAADEGPSLMDEMMAAGMAVHEEKKKKKKAEEKRVKKDFGNGLKGGFFNSPKPKAKKGTAGTAGGGKAKGGAVKKGFLDSKPSKAKKAAKTNAEGPQRIETLRPAPKDPSAKAKDPLRFDEVQEAMAASVGPMEKELGKGEWVTPDLMQTLASNPRLATGMQNPYYMAALAELQKDPKKAMEKIQKQADPGLKSFLEEFCGVMGQHFTSLGTQQQQQQQKQQQQAQQPNITPAGPASTPSQPAASMDTPQGPLAEAAMKKYMENARKAQEAGTAAPPMPTPNAEEDAKVDLVMRNQELRELLMDREMQEVMQKCGHPGALQHYMTDPTWGPKLRKLADAGLVRIER